MKKSLFDNLLKSIDEAIEITENMNEDLTNCFPSEADLADHESSGSVHSDLVGQKDNANSLS